MKLLKSVQYALFLFILIEITVRVFFAVEFCPDVLFYGTGLKKSSMAREAAGWERYLKTKINVWQHENKFHNYTKYYPNQKISESDKDGNVFAVTINRHGFRGDEFEIKKPEGVLRIICLGASSTFGYGDRDNETYPYFLEKALNNEIGKFRCDKIKSIEVLNFGIPHLRSENIYWLFASEAIPLNPDIVTFYEGVNDAREVGEFARSFFYERFTRIGKMLTARFLSIKLCVKLLHAREKTNISPNHEEIKKTTDSFRRNLNLIAEDCRRNHIKFAVVTQQAQSLMIDPKKLGFLSYDAEAILVESKIKKGAVTFNELYFFIHSLLMKELRAWARDSKTLLIDGIKALDNHRNYLVRWVHLNPDGNRILANEIAKSIFSDYQCGE